MQSCWSKTSSPSTRGWGPGGGFDLVLLEQRPGYLAFRAIGKGAATAFQREPGGHRWQRIPPTEKRGRVHTSTVTVAVLREPEAVEVRVDPGDLDWKTCRGSGAGGQHRNVTDSAVQLTHLPTGIMVRVESERSQHQNREAALGLLRARLLAMREGVVAQARSADRRAQVGTGMRGDKVRTIAVQRNEVVHHPTGARMTADRYLRGFLEDLG